MANGAQQATVIQQATVASRADDRHNHTPSVTKVRTTISTGMHAGDRHSHTYWVAKVRKTITTGNKRS